MQGCQRRLLLAPGQPSPVYGVRQVLLLREGKQEDLVLQRGHQHSVQEACVFPQRLQKYIPIWSRCRHRPQANPRQDSPQEHSNTILITAGSPQVFPAAVS